MSGKLTACAVRRFASEKLRVPYKAWLLLESRVYSGMAAIPIVELINSLGSALYYVEVVHITCWRDVIAGLDAARGTGHDWRLPKPGVER